MALTPIVQIVHYSDMHVRKPPRVDLLLLRLQRISSKLARLWQQGLAGADPFALEAFEEFLATSVRKDSSWSSVPLWLIDTGDATTFGDDASLTEWLDWSQRFAKAAATTGGAVQRLSIYGNHDAWPNDYPGSNPWGMEAQRDDLRMRWFTETYPDDPLRAQIPHVAGSEIQLYRANSVDHELWPSLLATGWAAPDRWWEPMPPMKGPSAADDVARNAEGRVPLNGHRHFRILAMHYPVAEAAQGTRVPLSKVLGNRGQFARDLQSPRLLPPPIAHLLLAGHTHEPFPKLGDVAGDGWGGPSHAPLSGQQKQWVAGSLSQVVLPGSTPKSGHYSDMMLFNFPHQASVMRLSLDTSQPHSIVVERAIAARDGGLPFDYLEISPGSGQHWETLVQPY